MKKRVPLLILSTLFLTSCSLPDFLESFLPTKETVFSEEEKKTETEETNETSVTTEEVLTETVPELETEPQTEYFPDPYTNVDESEFYRNYTPATSYLDSYYRTQHHLMSGSIEDQKQRPTIAENQPKDGDKYVANSKDGTSKDGLSYDIVDTSGKVVNTIYKGGAYVTLEEVAAYLYAFGEIPANYVTNKSTKPTESPWGKYLRLNHSYFTCDTTKYKYEPDLPDTSSKRYYEIDVGTTGSFEYSTARVGEYNNGKNITRGASRLVYTRTYNGGSHIDNPFDRYVFYTFNHYNDFQQYLNYQGGWGEWFGNIAGGGSMDNNTGIYKTAYPEVSYRDFTVN